MNWNITEDRPVYLQIIDQVKQRIINGQYLPGDKLPSVRDLASEASVNPNTMQRALSDLERDGLIFSERTSGRFVTEDTAMIDQVKISLARELVADFVSKMHELGFTTKEIIQAIEQIKEA